MRPSALFLGFCSFFSLANGLPQNLPDGVQLNDGSYSLQERGARNTLNWRIWLEKGGRPASFWHDVPLYPDPNDTSIVNFIVEIPRWTDGKIEIRRDEPLNPIFHDSTDDQVRFVESIWPHKSYPFTYGSIPQTWESPNLNHSFTGLIGDNDPVDCFDIGQDIGYIGQIKQVKILGALALADDGETDWKVLVVDVNDELAELVDSVEDLETYRPGLAESYRQWYQYYKVPRGDNLIEIVGESYQNASFSAQVILESHSYWQELVAGEVESNEINYNQTTLSKYGESYIDSTIVNGEFSIPRGSDVQVPAQRPEEYDLWYYLNEELELILLPEDAVAEGSEV